MSKLKTQHSLPVKLMNCKESPRLLNLGGQLAMNVGRANSELNSSEIQEEQVTELVKFEAR